jgi:ABC-type multidrug transport system ATPase subunit
VTHAAIAARGLEKRFGPVAALRGIDLEVPAATTLAVLGPNGAGKSTLLRLAAGLTRPTAGTLCVGDTREDRRRARGRVGYLAHASFLYAALTARENLVFAARLYGVPEPRRRAEELLEEQGLAAVAERPAGSFSRGMAQRLAIARGLIHDPSIVLLDEPYTGLDRAAANALTERLRELRAAGRTLVLVTHELSRACELADRAVVLARGRVVHAVEGPGLTPAVLEQAYLASVESAA